MKKILSLILGVTFICAFTSICSAQLIKGEIAKGPITFLDQARGQLTVNDGRSGRQVTYSVSPSMLSGLLVGQAIIVRSEKGVVKSIRPVVKRTANAASVSTPPSANVSAPSRATSTSSNPSQTVPSRSRY